MSRIGKAIVTVPSGVTVTAAARGVLIKGPKGELEMSLPVGFGLKQENGTLLITSSGSGKAHNSLHGFLRAEIANHIKGVTEGWTKTLELVGVGYRATVSGVNLVLNVGFSHQVTIVPPPGITFSVVESKIVISGNDKQAVGQIAAGIRDIKKPEPYKGKGIKYLGERIRKKAGKSAKAIGGAPGATK